MPKLSFATAYLLLRISIAFIWLYTAFISAVVSPEVGYELLRKIPITGVLADLSIYATSAVEVLLGIFVLLGRYTRPLALLQAAMIIGFTLIITLSSGLRELWLHPFAPVGKNLPILGGLAILYALGDKPTLQREGEP